MDGLRVNRQYLDTAWTTAAVQEEIQAGLEILNSIPCPIVTFFGGHRAKEGTQRYIHAKSAARSLAEAGHAILTGGGPGIMHAANAGATQASATSIGFTAELLTDEIVTDPLYTHRSSFHFLFVRRFLMSIKSRALVFYPGGYGTLNELFEYLVLMQTGITDTVPLICVDRGYWEGLFSWLERETLQARYLKNDGRDLELLRFADTVEEVVQAVRG